MNYPKIYSLYLFIMHFLFFTLYFSLFIFHFSLFTFLGPALLNILHHLYFHFYLIGRAPSTFALLNCFASISQGSVSGSGCYGLRIRFGNPFAALRSASGSAGLRPPFASLTHFIHPFHPLLNKEGNKGRFLLSKYLKSKLFSNHKSLFFVLKSKWLSNHKSLILIFKSLPFPSLTQFIGCLNNYYYCLLFFLLLLPSYQAQDSSFIISAKKIIADNIGNVYAINDAVITKYFTNKQIKTFSIKTFGTLENIDVSNALRILLFFKDFQKILFLDSQLSQNGDAIELSTLGYEQTSVVCSSFNNGFWIYHQANNELIRFNQTLEITIKTGNLKRLLNADIQPNFMIEHNGRLYLNSPNTGILVFDIYGAYLKTIPLTNLKVFQVHYPYLFYISGKKFCSFHLETFENIEITSIPDDCYDIFFNGTFCYWQCINKLKINPCIN